MGESLGHEPEASRAGRSAGVAHWRPAGRRGAVRSPQDAPPGCRTVEERVTTAQGRRISTSARPTTTPLRGPEAGRGRATVRQASNYADGPGQVQARWPTTPGTTPILLAERARYMQAECRRMPAATTRRRSIPTTSLLMDFPTGALPPGLRAPGRSRSADYWLDDFRDELDAPGPRRARPASSTGGRTVAEPARQARSPFASSRRAGRSRRSSTSTPTT